MKPSEIVQKALGKSLLIGAGVFIGMPVMAYILFDHEALISEPLDLIVFPVFYAIYISIQLVLSGLFFYAETISRQQPIFRPERLFSD